MMSDKAIKKGYDHQASMVIAFFDCSAPQAAKRRKIPSRHELIPDAPDGQDMLRMRRIFFHRFADAIDMDRDRSRIAE